MRLQDNSALAESWENTHHTAMSTYHNAISSISLFLLLDLLGSKNPRVPSYFKTTHWAYKNMATIEKRLRDLQEFKSSPNHPSKREAPKKRTQEPMFLPEGDKTTERFMGGMIQDDHVPFMARGVEVLHIIPSPFPRVWHDISDDGEHLDLDTVQDWAKLVTAFAGEWMNLEGYFDLSARKRQEKDGEFLASDKKKRKVVISKTEL